MGIPRKIKTRPSPIPRKATVDVGSTPWLTGSIQIYISPRIMRGRPIIKSQCQGFNLYSDDFFRLRKKSRSKIRSKKKAPIGIRAAKGDKGIAQLVEVLELSMK